MDLAFYLLYLLSHSHGRGIGDLSKTSFETKTLCVSCIGMGAFPNFSIGGWLEFVIENVCWIVFEELKDDD